MGAAAHPWPRLLAKAAAAASLGACLVAPALAHEHFYNVVLTGAGLSASGATGTALVTFDLDLVTARVEASFSGLAGAATGTWLHCCTASAGSGLAQNATANGTPSGFTTGGSSGSFDITYDLTVGSTYSASFIVASGGQVVDGLNALANGAEAGTVYLSIASTAFPNGEIRGFLIEQVPEPSTYALMAAGLAAVGWASRRRKALRSD